MFLTALKMDMFLQFFYLFLIIVTFLVTRKGSAMFSQEIFCRRLRQLRKTHKLTAEQLGKIFNVSKQTVSRWELGDRLPPLDVVVAIADYFGVSLDWLTGRTDQ